MCGVKGRMYCSAVAGTVCLCLQQGIKLVWSNTLEKTLKFIFKESCSNLKLLNPIPLLDVEVCCWYSANPHSSTSPN